MKKTIALSLLATLTLAGFAKADQDPSQILASQIPVGSKLILTNDIFIPPGEDTITLGRALVNDYIVTCSLYLSYNSSERTQVIGPDRSMKEFTVQEISDDSLVLLKDASGENSLIELGCEASDSEGAEVSVTQLNSIIANYARLELSPAQDLDPASLVEESTENSEEQPPATEEAPVPTEETAADGSASS